MNKIIVIMFTILIGISLIINIDKAGTSENEENKLPILTVVQTSPIPIVSATTFENLSSNVSAPIYVSFPILPTSGLDENLVYINLPNSDFDALTSYKDKFSDANGYRAYPWGFETIPGQESTINYFANGTAKMIGVTENSMNLFAVPDLVYDKPVAIEGYNYTLSFDVKLTNVSGHGVRIMQQWFNVTQPATAMPFKYNFDEFMTGSSEWHSIEYTVRAPEGAIRADPVLELWGKGIVEIKNPRFYLHVLDKSNISIITFENLNKSMRNTDGDPKWAFGTNDCERLKILNSMIPSGEEGQDKRTKYLMEIIAWDYKYNTVDEMWNYCIRSDYNMNSSI